MPSRVLLVEEDELLKQSIVRALRARGIGVDAYGSATEALQAAQAGATWGRALIDLSLREMDGATLAERLLAHLPELELTFATGGADARVLCHAHALGVVISKPIGLGPLCERFSSAVRRSGVVARATPRSDAAPAPGPRLVRRG